MVEEKSKKYLDRRITENQKEGMRLTKFHEPKTWRVFSVRYECRRRGDVGERKVFMSVTTECGGQPYS